MKSSGKFAIALGIGLVVVAGIATYQVSLVSPADSALPGLRFGIAVRSWITALFSLLPAAVASAALITFSLVIRSYDLPAQTPMIRAAAVPVAIVFAMGCGMVVWYTVLGPRVAMRTIQQLHRSAMANEAWNDARAAMEEGDLLEARSKVSLYGAIVGESEELADFVGELSVMESSNRPSASAGTAAGEERLDAGASEQSLVDLIELAQEFFDRGRYYSAHYYATRAIELSPVERLDARRIQQRAWEALRDEGRAIQDSEESRFFTDKFAAYTAMDRGSESPESMIEAYYRFQDLDRRRPNDPDVTRYLPIVEAALADISFFLDTARIYQSFPGVHNVLFENEPGEYVSMDSLIRVREGDFAYGVEIFRVDDAGSVLYHVRAPYGKFISGDLVVRAMRRDGIGIDLASNVIGPEYLSGGRDYPVAAFFPIRHPVDEIARFGPGTDWLKRENIGRLFAAVPLFQRLGLPVIAIYAQLVDRILRSIGVFVLFFASMAVGWRYRSRYVERPPVLVLLTVPFVPLAVWAVSEAVRYLAQIVLVRGFVMFGRGPGMAALALVPLAGLVWALASLARQSSS